MQTVKPLAMAAIMRLRHHSVASLFLSVLLAAVSSAEEGPFRAYVTTADGLVIIDTASNAVIGNLPLAGAAGVGVSPDGQVVFVAQPDESRLAAICARDLALLGIIPVPGRPGRFALTPDGALVVVTTQRTC